MASDEGNYSDEEILDNEWPEDFFDLEDNAVPEEETPVFVSQPIGDKTMYDLPLPCLQMILEPLRLRDRIRAAAVSTVFREAVATSKCIGGDQLIVTAEFAPPAYRAVRLFAAGRLGVPPVRVPNRAVLNAVPRGVASQAELTSYNVHLPGVVYRLSVIADKGQEIFENLQRYFNKLYLKELILMLVSIDSPLFDSFNAFLDKSCVFERLVIRIASVRLMTDRIRALVAKAQREVVIELKSCDITPELVRSIERPVRFKGMDWTTTIRVVDSGSLYLDDEAFFVELVKKGHSLEKLNAPLVRSKTLTDVIEIVSASGCPQKVDVSFESVSILQLFELYMVAINAKRGPLCSRLGDNWLDFRLNARTFTYGRATMFLAFQGVDPIKARLIVTSKSYESSLEQAKPLKLLC